MWLRSIRLKFISWYAVILAVTFSLFSFVLYSNFSKNLRKQTDTILLSKAEGIAESIDTYWETEKLDAVKGSADSSVFSKRNNSNFHKIAKRWVKETSGDPELLNLLVRIYDTNGGIIASSENMQIPAGLSERMFNQIHKGKSYLDSYKIATAKGQYVPFRVAGIPIKEENAIAYIVQVASPLASVYASLSHLRFLLFVLLPITIVTASIFAGEFLASITLKPLNKMIQTVRQITAENLQLRVEIPHTKDEIKKLADTFNEMLDKINHSFGSQKQFLHDVSHELRTPLTILKGELEVALKKVRSQDEYLSILNSNLEEINKIQRIVENLLMLARFDSNEAPFTFERIDLTQLIKDIVTDMETLAKQKSLEILLTSAETVMIYADKEKLRRLFSNLIDNAIKYSFSNAKIAIALKKESGNARIEVSDTGVGISNEDLPFIFNRFYRADKSRSSAGLGLGLSIAKSIVEAHHGCLEAKNCLPQGTTFFVSLPLLPSP